MNEPGDATPRGLDEVARVVSRTRSGLLVAVLATGLLLAVAAAVAWVVGGVLLDLAAPLPVAGRIAVLGGWWLSVALACAAFILLPAYRRPSLDAVALRIERVLGGMHNRLLTVVDLARGGGTTGGATRPRLVDRLLAETTERMREFRARRIVPWRALGRAACWVAGLVAVVALLHATLGDRLAVTLARLRDPTADIPPATWLQLRSPGDVEVLEREPFSIEAQVARGAVDALDLVLIDASGTRSRRPMAATPEGTFTASLEGLTEKMTYRLEGGGTWTKTHAISVVPRPEILGVERHVRLPDYMRIDTPLAVEGDAQRIEAPEGATVEYAAQTSAEAVAGSIRLFERTTESEVVERFDERVWFEDDLPRDAVAEIPWRWTTAQAAGGLRSFTFGADRTTLSMRTRLEPLVLPKERLDERAVTVMARLDAAAPPTWLLAAFEHDGGRDEIVWGDAEAAPPAGSARRFVAGPLPEPGDWTRLLAPLAKLAPLAGRRVTTATFSIDGGRIHLDRPGWVERVEETVQKPVDRPTGSIALALRPEEPRSADTPTDADAVAATAREAAPGPRGSRWWTGGVPVAHPQRAALEFSSARGDRNLPDPAVEIVPTVDRPPVIVVRDVPETLTLERPDDVPLAGSAFDDWGLDRLEIRIGPDPRGLGAPQPLSGVGLADRPPDTQATLPPMITAEQLGLEAGMSLAWQLLVVDTKGQKAESPVYRVVVMTPPEMELARSQVPSLAEARRAAEQLARDAEKTAESLEKRREEALAAVPEEARDTVAAVRPPEERANRKETAADQAQSDPASPEKTNPESPKPDEQKPAKQDQAKQDDAKQPQDQPKQDQQKQDGAKPDQKPDAAADSKADQKPDATPSPEQKKADAADAPPSEQTPQSEQDRAKAANEAAKAAVESLDAKDRKQLSEASAAIEKQRRAADDVARKVEAAAEQARKSPLVPEAQKDRLDALADEAREIAAELAPRPSLGEEAAMIDQVDAATSPEQLAAEARDLAAELADVERQLDAAGAAMQIAALARDLERRAERLDELAQADPAAMPSEDGADKQAADAGAPESAAAQPQPPMNQQAKGDTPPSESAAPTGEQAAASDPRAVPADTAKEAASQGDAQRAAAATDPARREAEAAAMRAETRSQIRDLSHILGKESAPPKKASAAEAAMTAEEAAERAADLAQRLAGPSPTKPAEPATPTPPAAPNPDPQAAADQAADQAAEQATEAAPSLADADVREALAMAQRSRILEARAAREAARDAQERAALAERNARQGEATEPGRQARPGEDGRRQPGGEPAEQLTDGGALAGSANLESALRGLDASQRAAVEALPPRVRDSLLEGMRQRGPEAYRSTIDAYFRALGRELPR